MELTDREVWSFGLIQATPITELLTHANEDLIAVKQKRTNDYQMLAGNCCGFIMQDEGSAHAPEIVPIVAEYIRNEAVTLERLKEIRYDVIEANCITAREGLAIVTDELMCKLDNVVVIINNYLNSLN